MTSKRNLGAVRTAATFALLLAGFCGVSAASSSGANIVVTLADPLMSLTAPLWTNGQMQFALNGESNVSYVIESSPDLLNWTPVATNLAAPVITVAAPDNAGFYRASRNFLPLFTYAVAARGNVYMNVSQLATDSFNSSDTNLSTNGQYDPTKTSTNGNVASAQGVVNLVNNTINGSLYLGPSATFTSSSIQVTGTIYSNYDVQFPDVVLPTTDTNGNPIVWQPAPTSTNTTYKKPIYFHDFTITYNNGYYSVGDSYQITVEPGVTATLLVTTSNFGPASITIQGGTTNSGTLVMYQNSGGAILGGNSSGGPIGNRPENFVYLGLPGVTYVTMAGTTTFVGAIYAPEVSLTLNGGANANNLEGAVIVNNVTENGHYTFHFDESLLTSGPVR